MKQLTDNPEENTQSRLTRPEPRNRRAESPWLWVQLLGGSLALHGALLAIALPLTARLSAAQSGTPTPVEFVELSEPSSQLLPKPAISQSPTEATVSPEPVPSPIQAQPTVSEAAPSNEISFAPEPSPGVLPSLLPSPAASPLPSSPEPAPEVSPSSGSQAENPFETAVAPPQPDSLPLPVLPSSPAQPSSELPPPQQPSEPVDGALRPEVPVPEPIVPEPRVPESPTPEVAVPETPLDANSDRSPSDPPTSSTSAVLSTAPSSQPNTPPSPGLETTVIDTPVPDVSEAIAAVPSTVDSDNLNAANSEAAPVGVTINLSGSGRIAPGGDEPDETLEVARPINNTSTFLPDPSVSVCQVTPDVLNWIGTPIALTITTEDQQDKPIDVSVSQSSGSLDYDQLATCLVKKQWIFEPATVLNAERTQRQTIRSDELLITITIDRS